MDRWTSSSTSSGQAAGAVHPRTTQDALHKPPHEYLQLLGRNTMRHESFEEYITAMINHLSNSGPMNEGKSNYVLGKETILYVLLRQHVSELKKCMLLLIC